MRAQGLRGEPEVPVPALIAEAARRSRVCWLGRPGAPRLAWHVWHEEALVFVCGAGEQVVEGLGDPDGVEVVLRSKDSRTRLVTWRGTVEVVPPDDPRWESHARALLGVRLNLVDPAGTLARWREEATVARVTPRAAR